MLEYRFAQMTAAATFVLLLIGGAVNPTGSSLACPEPTFVCHGELFPPMVGGVLYEHGHRLAAMTVGVLQIILTILLWTRRHELARWAVGGLLLVCFQGALGALTVKYKLPPAVSVSHLLCAMVYLASLIYVAWRVRPADTRRADEPSLGAELVATGLHRWITVAAIVVLAQILLGGLVRHSGGVLACLDMPLCHGRLIAPIDAPVALHAHLIHRVFGIIAGLIVLATALQVLRRARRWPALRALAVVAALAVGWQITFGVLTIATLRSVPIAVAHFGGAALLWATFCVMWLVSRPAAEPTR